MVIYPPNNTERSNSTYEKTYPGAQNTINEREVIYTNQTVEFEGTDRDNQAGLGASPEAVKWTVDRQNERSVTEYARSIATYRQLEVS